MGRTALSRRATAPPTRAPARRSTAQSPNGWSPRPAHATPASGSTQRNAPDCPKCPNVRGDASGGVQCGALAPFSSNPRPHGFGRCRPKPGQHPVEVGELWGGRLGEQLRGEHRPGVEELAGEAEQVAQRGPGTVGGGAGDRGRDHPERLEDRLPHVVRERQVGALGDELRRAPRRQGSRRCAAVPGAATGSEPSNGRPGRVAQEEADGGARGTGRLVELEDLLLHRDEHRGGGEQLGDRCQREGPGRRRRRWRARSRRGRPARGAVGARPRRPGCRGRRSTRPLNRTR